MRKMISELNFIFGGVLGLETMEKMAIMHVGYCGSISLAISWLSCVDLQGLFSCDVATSEVGSELGILSCHHSLFTVTYSMC